MLNRRGVLSGVLLVLAGCAGRSDDGQPTSTSDIWGTKADAPSAKAVKGHPNYLDFGDGLKVPLDQHAFLTLWEGPNFWLVYGAGRARQSAQAGARAVEAAEATMKLLLMTLAFQPDRLVRKDGGWRLKTQDVGNYVRGMLELPGKPFPPQSDTGMGFGNMENAMAAERAMMAAASSAAMGGRNFSGATQQSGADLFSGNKADAYTCYILKKSDVDLAYVRKYTRLDTLGTTAKK